MALFALLPLAARRVCADATPAQLGRARTQFQQGLALETAGDWAGALGLFQEVAAVRTTPQVRFNIAVCEEHLGRLALALGDYQLALAEAEGNKAPEVAAQTPGRIEGLLVRIPKVVIRRGAGADYAAVSLDGITLGATSIGGEMPVDPGPHTIEARAPGFNLFMTSFNIAEGQVKAIDVTLARNAAASHAPASGPPADPLGEPKGRDSAGGAVGKPSILPYVVGGAGAASLVASGVFFVLRSSAINDLDRLCGTQHECPPDAEATFERGKAYTTLADVTFALGLAGVGTGVVLYFTQEKSAPVTAALDASFGAPGAPAGATLRGRF